MSPVQLCGFKSTVMELNFGKALNGNLDLFQLLPWPESKDEDKEEKEEEKSEDKDKEEQEDRIIVNDVSISSDCKYIVSVTNKNLVCVWQKA